MNCPACGEELLLGDGASSFWFHLASCGVEVGGHREVVCACGVTMPSTSRAPFIEHLNTPHDWPKVLTRSAMENM